MRTWFRGLEADNSREYFAARGGASARVAAQALAHPPSEGRYWFWLTSWLPAAVVSVLAPVDAFPSVFF